MVTTGERMVKIETKLDEHCKQGIIDHKAIMSELKSLKVSFAGKWVEKGVITLAVVGLTLILTLIGYII